MLPENQAQQDELNPTDVQGHAEPADALETHPSVETAHTAEVDHPEPEMDAAQRENEARLKQVLTAVLNDEATDFAEVLPQYSPQELVLLMEELAIRELDRNAIRRVGQIKKQWDELFAARLKEVNAQVDDDAHPELQDEAKAEKERLTHFSVRLSRALVKFNKRRAEYETQQNAEREQNLITKKALLEDLKAIVMAEEVTAIDKVRAVQKKWRDIGQVPQADVDNIMQTYRTYLDQFYGLREKYNDLLEQDRKVNLEEKEKLIHELEELVGMPHSSAVANAAEATDQQPDIDVANASEAPEAGTSEAETVPVTEHSARYWQETADKVKALHEAWKHVGPVPREQTEALWARFKAATDFFYEQRRGFFGERDQERGANTDAKRALVEKAQSYTAFASDSKDAWMKASQELQALMENWKQIGPATAEGKSLFKQFRDAQNAFYKKRAQFFQGLNSAREGLVKQKEELLAKAEVLAAEAEGPNKTEQFKNLQREWKATGSDDYKEARKLQKKFRKICDTFFNGLKAQRADQHQAEQANLDRKVALLDQLDALYEAADAAEREGEAELLLQEIDSVGHVPIKQKDKMLARMRKAQDRYRELYRRGPRRQGYHAGGQGHSHGGNRGGQHGGGHAGETHLEKEQRRIMGRVRQLEETIQQYENNILFISRGKSGDALRNDIESKIAAARDEISKLKAELKALRKAEAAKHEAPAAEAPVAETPATETPAADAPATEA